MNKNSNKPQRRGGSRFGRRRTFSSVKSQRGAFRSGRSGRNSNKNVRRFGTSRGGGNRTGRKMPTFDPSKFINTNPTEYTPETYIPKNTFRTFGLREKLVKTIEKIGLTTPSPIQDQIILPILEGNDVIGLAETGTGKTAAFLIPLIERTLNHTTSQTLILTPTRELAIQIEQELRILSAGFRIFSTTCIGGVNIRPQIKALKRTNHFVIGTPGRILDLIKRKSFTTDHVSTVVIDEADRMLDMGFIHDMKKILGAVPKQRTTLLFSATMSYKTRKLVLEFLKNPVSISVKKKDVTDNIEQNVISYENANKFETLHRLLGKEGYTRVLVFGAMKHSVNKLAKQLSKCGINAESIHGNKSHVQRQRALAKFKQGHTRVLVATDVAARGIHVDDVSHVINYDLPTTFEDYVHRIGRTGRCSKRGKALTFVPSK